MWLSSLCLNTSPSGELTLSKAVGNFASSQTLDNV